MTEKKQTLTRKQKCFCHEYIKDLNATQSAIRAGYSKKTAQRIGSENLSKPLLSDYIQTRMSKREKRTKISADFVLNGLKEVAEINAATYETENGTVQINSHAAIKAYELIGKHLILFTDHVQIGADQSLADAIKSASETMTLAPFRTKQ